MTDLKLEMQGDRLILFDPLDLKMAPLVVDFLDPKLLHRLRFGLSRNQPFGKALGLTHRPDSWRVLDATAGVGVDAFIMAALGCEVISCERSKTVYQLLQDGERRLRAAIDSSLDPELRGQLGAIAARLRFVHGDAVTKMHEIMAVEKPDVIYLDPMYPEEGRSETALPKKNMQYLRRLLGDDLDAEQVLNAALRCARARVVVKRPLRAPVLLANEGNKKPAHSFAGKTARFDLYLVS